MEAIWPSKVRPVEVARSVRYGAAKVPAYRIAAITGMEMRIERKTLPRHSATTSATRKVTTERSASGIMRLPGRMKARKIVTGIMMRAVVMTSGLPTTTAASRPMESDWPPKCLVVNFWAPSEMGMRPSTNMAVILGMSTMTAATLTPVRKIWSMGMRASAPMAQPRIRPSIIGSPKMPRYFWTPLIETLTLLRPGMRSITQLSGAAMMIEDV